MLNCAQKFENAFYMFDLQDENVKDDLESGDGIPIESDWKVVRELVKFLEHFYELTNRVSGTSYVTSNCLFDEICEIDCLLRECKASDENEFSLMAMKMKDKFHKYWGSIDKLNMLIFVAIILDPRHKFCFVEFALKDMFEGTKGTDMATKVKDAVYELFNAYKPSSSIVSSSSTPTSSSNIGECQARMKKRMQEKFVKHKLQSGSGGDQMSELDKYLSEAMEPVTDDFNILLWRKVNSPRFPYLSLLA
ncbi:PREDICTED: zinc finger BED domain-containing protein RICESLEEPER 1-like [Ipomoea nil]|uniref:zinc finger BED domain-containing protein RICESLEEPER 1-like n=1 Tax=Ipomoea nil TaxID=35883 RepID=UPI00090169E1|nr:PREDICTED: zinc finger BED domain-containing protein RICESLEEPER 1-like [Ipomoea nil]